MRVKKDGMRYGKWVLGLLLAGATGQACAGKEDKGRPAGGESCMSSGDCAFPTPYCQSSSRTCVACLSDQHCPESSQGEPLQCDTQSGSCRECTSDAECGGPGQLPYCHPRAGLCVECLTDTNCRGDVCHEGRCASCGNGLCDEPEESCPEDCSSGAGGRGAGGQAGTGGVEFGVGGSVATGGLGGGSGGDGGGGRGDGGGTCETVTLAFEPTPRDLFLMWDQSSSMGELVPNMNVSWWAATAQGLTDFVDDPRSTGIGLGIQYFPLNGVAPASCTAPYSTPEVPVGPLPGVATLIAQSVAQHGPTTFTPTGPALQGAIHYTKFRAAGTPGRAQAVVLVTDGFPTECEPSDTYGVAEIARVAMETEPRVRTFVIGISAGLGNLREIAHVGGTGDAFLIEGGDARGQLANALRSIAAVELGCEVPLPAPQGSPPLDPDLVSVAFTPRATGTLEMLPFVGAPGSCTANLDEGWYYDNPTAPTAVHLCPATCVRRATGSLDLRYGCANVR